MAQRTSLNRPYGRQHEDDLVKDISELFEGQTEITNKGIERQLVIYGFNSDEDQTIVKNTLVDVNGDPIIPTFVWSNSNLTINGLGTTRANSSLIVNFENHDNTQGTNGTNVIAFGGNVETYFTAIYTDYRGY
jgi:hypothetical protein